MERGDLIGAFVTAAVSVIGAMSILMLISWLMQPAHAHSDGHMTYPWECCSNQDCAPVDKSEVIQVPMSFAGMAALPQKSLPTMLQVTTKHGTAIVPDGLKRHVSQDGRAHACIRATAMGVRVICYFEPPGM